MTNTVKVGDAIILVKDIYDHGEDHHPPGYIAFTGEKVLVKEVRGNSLVVAHAGAEGGFLVHSNEWKTE